MTSIDLRKSVFGLPFISAGMFTGTGGDVQVFTKTHTIASFNVTRLDSAETPLVVDRTTANAFVVHGTYNGGIYSVIATGHG